MSIRRCLIPWITLLAPVAAAADPTPPNVSLDFAHYAPGAGEVRFFVDGVAAHTLAYRDFVADSSPISPGTVVISAVRAADAQLLAEQSLILTPHDQAVVILAGNGRNGTPFELRLSPDHNHPMLAHSATLQEANLAIVRTASGAPAGARYLLECPLSGAGDVETQPVEWFGHGTAPFNAPTSGSQGLRSFDLAAGATCRYALRVGDPTLASSEGDLTLASGGRYRRFVIGDGINAPYEVVHVTQSAEPVLAVISAGPFLRGFWQAPTVRGTVFDFAFDAAAVDGRSVSALMYGYRADGAAGWMALIPDVAEPGSAQLPALQVVRYSGNPRTSSLSPIAAGKMRLIVHSCQAATLITSGPMTGAAPLVGAGPPPRNAIRLERVFPTDCPPPVVAKGVAP